jgi:YD repeat-containing protein
VRKKVSGVEQVVSRTEFSYDQPTGPANVVTVRSWDSTKASLPNVPGFTPPANPPLVLNSANSISAVTQYNQYGMPVITTDARGIQTHLTYGPLGTAFELYPTVIETAYNTAVERTETREHDFATGLVTRVTDGDNQVSGSTTYDVFGRPTLVIAAEGKPEETRTVNEYSDVDRRIVTRSDLYTAGDAKRIAIQHFDQLGRIRLSRHLENSTQSTTDESIGIKVQTRHKFSGTNSYNLVSGPYRAATSGQAGSESTMGWTLRKFDQAGRTLTVQSFSGSGLPAPWSSNNSSTGTVTTAYSFSCSQSLCGSFTIVTDQANRLRRSMSDGLGRLKRVDEPDGNGNLGDLFAPNLPTDYSYDVSDNLIGVVQSGNGATQNRLFSYSSLSRLTSATNPENGTIYYKYDESGNLIVKSDARIQPNTTLRASIHYSYDALNRITRRWYNGSTSDSESVNGNPALPTGVVLPDEAHFRYDAQSLANLSPGAPSFSRGYSAGRLVAVTYGPGTSSSGDFFAYDALGRQTLKVQQTGGVDYKISATHKPAGISTLTYPSGHAVTYNFDAAGRLGDQDTNLAFTGNLGDGVARIYTRGLTYESTGAMKEERLGTATALYHKRAYNARGQVTDIRISTTGNDDSGNRGKISNWYGTTNNNGNLLQQNVYLPTNDQGTTSVSWYQTYYYDTLNRLTGVGEWNSGGTGLWGQFFDYDRSINGIPHQL